MTSMYVMQMPAKAVCVLKGTAGVEGTITFVEQADGKILRSFSSSFILSLSLEP